MRIVLLFALPLAMACSVALPATPAATRPAPPAPTAPEPAPRAASPLADQAVAGVDSAELRTLLAEHWEWLMAWAPTYATTLGDHRRDDQLGKRDAAAYAQ